MYPTPSLIVATCPGRPFIAEDKHENWEIMILVTKLFFSCDICAQCFFPYSILSSFDFKYDFVPHFLLTWEYSYIPNSLIKSASGFWNKSLSFTQITLLVFLPCENMWHIIWKLSSLGTIVPSLGFLELDLFLRRCVRVSWVMKVGKVWLQTCQILWLNAANSLTSKCYLTVLFSVSYYLLQEASLIRV